jgi:hypothetical protein
MKTLNDKLNKFRNKLWKKEPSCCTYLYWTIEPTNVRFQYYFAGTFGVFNIPTDNFNKYKVKELVQSVRQNTFNSLLWLRYHTESRYSRINIGLI